MPTLITADGRALRRQKPGAKYLSSGAGAGRPLWSSGTQDDAYGDHTPSGYRLASYAEIYETQPVVASVVNKIFRRAATIPLKVYKRNSDNSRERVADHPLADLINNPCPRRSSVDLLSWIMLPLLVHGNALLFKYRKGPDEPVTELYPIDWTYISAYAQQGGPVEWWGTTEFGEERFFRAEDAVHFAWRMVGSEIGVSPLKQLGITLKIEDAAQRHTASSFANGVRPSIALILHPDTPWNEETREMTRKGVERNHAGPDKQGGVFIAGAGSDVKVLSHTAREAELISTRKLTALEICSVYDTKPTIIGIFDNATYSNITETNQDFYKTTLTPWFTLLQSTVEAQLIRDEPTFQGVFAEFDLTEQLKGNPLERFQSYALQITNGIRTINEVRRLENLPPDPSPEADKLWLPTNNLAPIDQVQQQALDRVQQDMTPRSTTTVRDVVRDPKTNRITQLKETKQ